MKMAVRNNILTVFCAISLYLLKIPKECFIRCKISSNKGDIL